MRHSIRLLLAASLAMLPATAGAQTFRSADSVIRRMWQVGMEQSQTEKLAQVLVDSIGPRLSGSTGYQSAVYWLERTYKGWGVTVRSERYGTWRGWRQGTVHMQLIAPRLQNLEVELLAWSPGTGNRPVEGNVVVIPQLADSVAARQWLTTVRGKFLLVSAPEIMCRAAQELERYARPATVTRINARRAEAQRMATARFRALVPAGIPPQDANRAVYARLDAAGVIGVGTLTWAGGWGVNRVFGANTQRAPSVDLSCEDY
ncbi:MAG: hypothetical protein ACR2G6_04440, partial [Gemmatimonadaceae bacterium]